MPPKLSIGISLLWLPTLPAGVFALPGDGFVYPWRDHVFRHRPGGYTDGMSDQKIAHVLDFMPAAAKLSALMDPWGWAAPAAVPHDGGYHGAIDIWTGAAWQPFRMGQDDCDTMFKDLLDVQAGDDPDKQALVIPLYEAVHLFGREAYVVGQAKPATVELPA